MKPQQVSSLINCLTDNEDERQDLWVHYLSGNAADSFASKLQKIQLESEDLKIKEALWTICQIQSHQTLSELFSKFSDFERHIIFLLLIDYSPEQISSHKGISEVRIRQAISSIRYNNSWKEYYGTEEKLNGRREIWPESRRDQASRKISKKK